MAEILPGVYSRLKRYSDQYLSWSPTESEIFHVALGASVDAIKIIAT